MNSATDGADRHDHDILYPTILPFLSIHIAAFAALWTGVSGWALGLCAALYGVRMFGVTGGYHRYFSHRAYSAGRVFQFLLAFLAQSSGQKSVLWWAAKHRHHHLYSDTREDVHSPRHTGFLYSHVGWIFARRHDTADLSNVPDLTRFPELRWLHRHEQLPLVTLGIACFALGGWQALVVGFVWSTVLVYHATFCINSLAHVSGTQRYVTGDDSRNNLILAILTMGEGWHNNHHAFQRSARQGFRRREIDLTFYILKLLSLFGIVRGLKGLPARFVRNEHRLAPKIVHRTAELLAARFHPRPIAEALQTHLREDELSTLHDTLQGEPAPSAAVWRLFHPHIPCRDTLRAEARALFARTPSLDEIVDRAHQLVIAGVRRHLPRPANASV